MPEDTRFFLGYGERLTRRVPAPGGGGGNDPEYSFEEAVTRLTPMVRDAASGIGSLARAACPGGEAVGVITLHPQWIAKSYHPQQLLDSYELRQVGSRPVLVQPERWSRREDPSETPSAELYVAGSRGAFAQWAQDLEDAPGRVSPQIRRLESVRSPSASERTRNIDLDQEYDSEPLLLEVVLHASESDNDLFILSGFAEYAESLGAAPHFERRIHAGGLCFLPVEARAESVDQLVEFAFLRVARPMPRLREFQEIERSSPLPGMPPAPLPSEDAVDPDLRIAVFDGGVDKSTALSRWVTSHDAGGVGASTDRNMSHGHDVTSALLFGSLSPGEPAPRPYAVVDHYRVLDKDAANDPYELYEVLRRVDNVLQTRGYEFFNLSIGPYMPVEDDEVHPWTALLDQHLSDGHALASLAVGNTGDAPGDAQESRIQVPADCVNGLSVGATDSRHPDWKRATYSSRGPGRSPGVVKPDVVHFGGCPRELFLVYDKDNVPSLAQTYGTSFSAPAALRLAAGVRAHFGSRISPLALKALLIHSAEPNEHEKRDVGWGQLPDDVSTIAVCEDGMVRIIYQGQLTPSQYLRASIPIPEEPLTGMVGIEATFCYASPIDPQDPGSYTRSGLEVTFRPHATTFGREDSTVPKSKSFFKRSDFDTEQTLRNDAQKWETTLHAALRFRPTSLYRPVFDIHYNARTSGGIASGAEKIRYALVITLRANRVPDLYDRVVRAFAGQLEALAPIVEIPIRV